MGFALILLSLLILGVGLTFYRFQKSQIVFHGLSVLCLIIGIIAGYWQWGGWREYMAYKHQQALLNSFKSPQELIEKIQDRLKQNPESAKGWFLLGRLYAAQGEWRAAMSSFKKAHDIEPQNVETSVHYAQSLWQLNQQKFTHEIRGLYRQILSENSNQPDALSMLAIDAFQNQEYQKAIQLWNRLLPLLSKDSTEANAVRQAIARARAKRQVFKK